MTDKEFREKILEVYKEWNYSTDGKDLRDMIIAMNDLVDELQNIIQSSYREQNENHLREGIKVAVCDSQYTYFFDDLTQLFTDSSKIEQFLEFSNRRLLSNENLIIKLMDTEEKYTKATLKLHPKSSIRWRN